ncbi:MAG TPA: arsenite efflux transporter metallochaperone ArsD [Deinococcales bacterium]|nr:arsenite efflux transporter metallochaperone ArsD [Deinococcales bacterium]
MKKIEVYDPPMCCGTGVCGADVDQDLVAFAADVDWANRQGAGVKRFNLSQQAQAFVENPVVLAILRRSGQEALPLVLVDGDVALAGRYPRRAELARWLGVGAKLDEDLFPMASATSGGCCGPDCDC